MNKKVKHTRAYASDIMDFQKEMPGISSKDVIRAAWQQYKAVQKAGRFIYGKKIWDKDENK